ncbi:hypothetical protein [Microbacterium maritypicum]
MPEYAPTTKEMRAFYTAERLDGSHLEGSPAPTIEQAEAEFDRWLAEVRASVVTEEPEWEYGHDCDESRATHGMNPSPQNEWPAMGTCTNATSYRRRKAGPWVPVKQEGETDA